MLLKTKKLMKAFGGLKAINKDVSYTHLKMPTKD